MRISIEACAWWGKTRKVFFITPGFMIDCHKIYQQQHVTFALTWLFWTVGIVIQGNE